MDFLNILFPVSGVKTNILLPPLIAMFISFFTSMAGISGAFLLLPFQLSVLNYTAPSVSGTNHVFNITAVPSGVYRYVKENRMVWPLAWVITAGTLPGVFLGFYIRVLYLPDPKVFKFFVGCVLLYIGSRLLKELVSKGKIKPSAAKALEEKFKEQQSSRLTAGIPSHAVVKTKHISLKRIEYEFWGETFLFNPIVVFILSFVVGIIGGAYGIGGGSIIAPFCISMLHLPAYTIAGAALMGTFMTSIAGALFYSIPLIVNNTSSMPDWPLGILFGIGGFAGMYLGARFQKFVPQQLIKTILGIIIVFLSIRYVSQFFV